MLYLFSNAISVGLGLKASCDWFEKNYDVARKGH
jgi:hypothetical protein